VGAALPRPKHFIRIRSYSFMAGRSNYGSLASISPACGPQNCPDLVPLKSCTNAVFHFHQSVATQGVGPREFEDRTQCGICLSLAV
jgi:hypothetical protein